MTTSGSPIDDVKELILWARKERVVLGRVTIGDVTVEIADMIPAAGNVDIARPPDVGNLYRTFGGDAVVEAMAAASPEIGVVEDDDEVAIEDPPRRRR